MTSDAMAPVPNGHPGTTALAVHHLTGPRRGTVIRDVSFDVAEGATHVVLGPMHSGKSMLVRLMLGLERATVGTVRVNGVSVDAANPDERDLRDLRRRIGVVFDSSALVSRLTMLENVELPLVEHTPVSEGTARERAITLLGDVGVIGGFDRTPDTISRLDRRRTALARALALDPAVLLIDEPGNGLDPHAAAELDETLRALHQRHRFGVVICTQEVRYAFHWPNAVSVLAGGRIVEAGELDRLLHSRHETVRRFVDRRGVA